MMKCFTKRYRGAGADRGFTIIELMVVVSLIALMLGFSVPLVFKIDELSRDRSGVNTFGVAVSAARAYAGRKIADGNDGKFEFSGAGVLVTTHNELRIIEDMQLDAMENLGLSQFSDNTPDMLRMDPIAMPRGMGVAGIGRSAAGSVEVLAPPFAIRFNKHGQLVAETRTASGGSTSIRSNIVYYTVDGAAASAGSVRPAGYTPCDPANAGNNWDPDCRPIDNRWNATAQRYNQPFHALECVLGVVVYAKADFEDAGGKFPSTIPSLGCKDKAGNAAGCQSIAEWMFDNGTVLFFSRNTGTIIRTKRQ